MAPGASLCVRKGSALPSASCWGTIGYVGSFSAAANPTDTPDSKCQGGKCNLIASPVWFTPQCESFCPLPLVAKPPKTHLHFSCGFCTPSFSQQLQERNRIVQAFSLVGRGLFLCPYTKEHSGSTHGMGGVHQSENIK